MNSSIEWAWSLRARLPSPVNSGAISSTASSQSWSSGSILVWINWASFIARDLLRDKIVKIWGLTFFIRFRWSHFISNRRFPFVR
jgi:hypothetical protein